MYIVANKNQVPVVSTNHHKAVFTKHDNLSVVAKDEIIFRTKVTKVSHMIGSVTHGNPDVTIT